VNGWPAPGDSLGGVAGPGADWVVQRPAPPLRGLIDSYVGYREAGRPGGIHRGLPSRHLTFIVSIGEPIRVVAQTDPAQAPASYDVVLGGLQASTALIASDGVQEGVVVELTPLGCRGLLGLPAQALWNLSVEADDVLGRAAVELRERLHATRSWTARFAACDDVLGRLLGLGHPVPVELRQAWTLVLGSGGTIPVGDVADGVGWSRRQLARRFSDEFGLSPKLAARVVRFGRARQMLQLPSRPSFADVAVACGYYDQPHLNRDFVELAGCPPGAWLAAEVPYVQDPAAVEAPPSAA